MITHRQLVETVATEAQLPKPDEAAHVARTVLADLSLRLDMPQRRRLRQALPSADRDAAYAITPPRKGGATDFLRDVGEHLDAPPARARYLAQTVLSTIQSSDPDLANDISPSLEPDIAELFTESAVPGKAAQRVPAAPPPTPLTAEELTSALRERPEWRGDIRRLERTVSLPFDRVEPLLRRVERKADGLQHTFRHRVRDGRITFALSTRSVGAVTEVDLRLADAIDATVSSFGPGGHRPTEGR